MKTGDSLPSGFQCVEAREEKPATKDCFGHWIAPVPGYFEVQRELESGGVVKFSASSEKEVLDRAARWLAEQAAKKSGGSLAESKPQIRVVNG